MVSNFSKRIKIVGAIVSLVAVVIVAKNFFTVFILHSGELNFIILISLFDSFEFNKQVPSLS